MMNEPTTEQLNKMPRLYETENIRPEDKIVHFHFQTDQCHWWAMEWDREDTFFGYVLLHGCSLDAEYRYFTLSELLEVKVEGWLEVENDPTWIPRAVKDVGLIRETMHFQSLKQALLAQQSV